MLFFFSNLVTLQFKKYIFAILKIYISLEYITYFDNISPLYPMLLFPNSKQPLVLCLCVMLGIKPNVR